MTQAPDTAVLDRATGAPDGAPQTAADVLVVFGIAGDLAKVTTFRSLYAPGTSGPEAANKPLAGHGRWHGPWVTQ
jgi:hypothetical protein